MFGEILQRARKRSGLTQSQIAQRVETSQPSYNAIENGTRIPRLDTALRSLEGVGLQVSVYPSKRPTVSQISQSINHSLAHDSADACFRLLLQLSDNLRNAGPAEAVGLALTEPEPLPKAAWANALAGIVEHSLRTRNLPVPDWTRTYVSPLENPVEYDVFDGWKPVVEVAAGEVPESLRARGVFLEESELISA